MYFLLLVFKLSTEVLKYQPNPSKEESGSIRQIIFPPEVLPSKTLGKKLKNL
jgi:hypothetical protein